MRTKTIGLIWINVKDLKKAVQFYTDVVGLKLLNINEEWGWAELEGHNGEGAILGISQQRPHTPKCPIDPGQNAVMTFTVDNIQQAVQELTRKGATLIGKIEEVPGHVKMQLLEDVAGNKIQIVETLDTPQSHKHEHSGCCGGH
jgi:predicted enzyme related to lactoylglutathione lyase